MELPEAREAAPGTGSPPKGAALGTGSPPLATTKPAGVNPYETPFTVAHVLTPRARVI